MEEVTFEFIYLRIFSMFVRVFDICHRGRVWSVVRSRVPVKLWKIPIKLIHTCHTDETPCGNHIDTKLCLKCTKIPWGITHVSHIETRLGFNSLKIQRGDNSCKSYRVETWFTVLSQPLLLQQVQPVLHNTTSVRTHFSKDPRWGPPSKHWLHNLIRARTNWDKDNYICVLLY